ncbi:MULTISPECIES: tRNA pseudouridine(55) synthase TruB [Salimicrobium]|uniref:tRNA pseudouridine synthase B n=1 Tax=Salimicrobium humidisoli TaxID=2029857 RepID=A0ABX4HRP7_9BACI|nr:MULTISPECIES: tRNA pseudouridine(55) synthase TruB [Salimicrobium]PBB05907.1 tRNA pseudouridine(55) synthase TruB [Salimicrobium humidisoli]
MDGIFPLWKPKGLTSHDCVVKVRKVAGTKKIGHTGTLDPEVEGVLPLCIGKATKLVPFLTDTEKTYEAVISLGTATETEDAWGEAIGTAEVPDISDDYIQKVLEDFQGHITQVPPMYSAVKVNGRRLYEYAREGMEVERPERQVTIHELHWMERVSRESFRVKVVCSKGTYIRTLCVDIGKALGLPAHMKELTRTGTGEFTETDCVRLEDLDRDKLNNGLLPMKKAVPHLPEWEVTEEEASLIRNGQRFDRPASWSAGEIHVAVHQGELLALYHDHPDKPGLIKPIRVLKQ